MRYVMENSPAVPELVEEMSVQTYDFARCCLHFLTMVVFLGPTLGQGPSEQVGVSSTREATF